jgi:hypothetical protein
MSDILDAARAHFERMSKQRIEVAEWSSDPETPAVITFAPLTLRARQQLQARAKGNEARLLALTVILHAKDEGGKPILPDTAETLKIVENEIDPKVLARIAAAILGVSEADTLGN